MQSQKRQRLDSNVGPNPQRQRTTRDEHEIDSVDSDGTVMHVLSRAPLCATLGRSGGGGGRLSAAMRASSVTRMRQRVSICCWNLHRDLIGGPGLGGNGNFVGRGDTNSTNFHSIKTCGPGNGKGAAKTGGSWNGVAKTYWNTTCATRAEYTCGLSGNRDPTGDVEIGSGDSDSAGDG
jgi:hypothetical protein